MTSMPEMVALFNGFGGMASLLVGWASVPGASGTFTYVTIILAILIGGLTFTGSLVAYGKLSERISSAPVLFNAQQVVNGAIVAGILGSAAMFCMTSRTLKFGFSAQYFRQKKKPGGPSFAAKRAPSSSASTTGISS